MSRIELSITTDYVKSWDAWAGIREWVQNARDAEIQFNAPMKIDWYNDTLRIENTGVTLPRESLLLGFTSKGDRSDLAGFWGEGYKIGTLALVRAGHSVKIRSGSEVWVPSIERSDKYDADVLVFNIEGGRKDEKRIRVEIGGVTKDEWDRLKTLFLFLNKTKNENTVSTTHGDLLLSEEHQGKLFVKGIYVHSTPLACGYNFKDAKLDRDRKMINSWERSWQTSWIWKEAAAKRPDLVDRFLGLVEDEKEDVKYIGESSHPDIDHDLSKRAAEKFIEKNGKSAVPVSNLAESQALEHLGAKGVIVSKSLGAVLRSAVGSVDDIQEKLRKTVNRHYSWHELSAEQQASITWAIGTLGSVCSAAKLELIDVVNFGDPMILGQYKDGRVLVSIRVVTDPEETLATMIHEFSHANGGDGDKGHVGTMEGLWVDVVKYLRRSKS